MSLTGTPARVELAQSTDHDKPLVNRASAPAFVVKTPAITCVALSAQNLDREQLKASLEWLHNEIGRLEHDRGVGNVPALKRGMRSTLARLLSHHSVQSQVSTRAPTLFEQHLHRKDRRRKPTLRIDSTSPPHIPIGDHTLEWWVRPTFRLGGNNVDVTVDEQ